MDEIRKGLVLGALLIITLAGITPAGGAGTGTDPFGGTYQPAATFTIPGQSFSHTIPTPVPVPASGTALTETAPLPGGGIASFMTSTGPGSSLQAAIDATPDGGTLYLDPGTYHEHDITIAKNIMIRSNPGSGGSRASTIIDAGESGRIFNVTGAYSVTIRDLTLQNGFSFGPGGAVLSPFGGTLTISNDAFENNHANETPGNPRVPSGGAIYASGGTLLVDSSSFHRCSADAWGGAIESFSPLTVTGSTFTDCSADVDGGALDFYENGATIVSSAFTNCQAGNTGGAIWFEGNGGNLTIGSSSITSCSAINPGGAIYSSGNPGSGHSISITSSAITGCTSLYGGAIYAVGTDLDIVSSFISDNSAEGYGGAVFLSGQSQEIIDKASFRNDHATSGGGAIAVGPLSSLRITSSDFEGCSAEEGGAMLIGPISTVNISFSRIYRNSASLSGEDIRSLTGSVDARNNWWGTNNEPAPYFIGGGTYDPWLVLGLSSTPPVIGRVGSSVIHASLTGTSAGTDTSGGGVYVPDGITSLFAITDGYSYASLSPSSSGTSHGVAAADFWRNGAVGTTLSATVDNQTVYLTLPLPPGPVTTLDTRDSGSSSGTTTVVPTSTGGGGLPLTTVTVNIGGDSKAWQAVVTGTKLSDLILTGTVQNGGGDNRTALPGIVFQYIRLEPARYDTITKALINFSVPQSWLDANHIAPGSIVLYHQTADGWMPLPTTFLYAKDGTAYFSAESPGFSLFAIAGATAPATPAVTTTQAAVSAPVQELPPVTPVATRKPVTTETTAPPAATPQPAASSPVMTIVLVIAAIGIVAGGGFMARRWWIRRQNPALFAGDD